MPRRSLREKRRASTPQEKIEGLLAKIRLESVVEWLAVQIAMVGTSQGLRALYAKVNKLKEEIP
jgi:hypothetical protein